MSWCKSLSLIFFLVFVFSFQNCAKVDFSSAQGDFSSLEEDVLELPSGQPFEPSTPAVDVASEAPVFVPVLPKSWAACDKDFSRIGQLEPVQGVTCADVCSSVGKKCSYRAAQGDFNACYPAEPPRSGDCGTPFTIKDSSQCICE